VQGREKEGIIDMGFDKRRKKKGNIGGAPHHHGRRKKQHHLRQGPIWWGEKKIDAGAKRPTTTGRREGKGERMKNVTTFGT